MKSKFGLLIVTVVAMLQIPAANATLYDLAHPTLALQAEEGPFGFGGRGVIFRADQNFTMTSFGMEGRWDGTTNLGIDVYSVAAPGTRALISQSTFANQAWSGNPFTFLNHSQLFTAGNIYEVMFRFDDPGLIFPHYNFDNTTNNPANGYAVGPLTVLDGSDFDTAQARNSWLAHFQLNTGLAVPEPTSLALLGLGLAAVGFRRHKAA